MAKVRMSRGKFDGLSAVADERGIIAALALDQRGSLRKAIARARGSEVGDAELGEFRAIVTELLTPYASAVLLDPEYGLEAANRRAEHVGLLLAYEKSGYDATAKGRLPDLLPEWSVRQHVGAGADAIKILLYYDPDDEASVNIIKHAFVERVGDECRANDVPFFLEPVCYSDELGDEQSFEFARAKPAKVAKYMREFSQPQYGVDVLKVEVPVNVRYVEGTAANRGGQVAYTREEAKEHFRRAAAEARVPFIYLSAGVTDEVFRESLALAAEAGVPFAGVLCGRATWQDGIPAYAKGGAAALRVWLSGRGVENMRALNELLARSARPWWDVYGGKDNVEVVGQRNASC